MSEIGKHKLSDALKPRKGGKAATHEGRPAPTPADTAEQAREAHERDAARNAEASNRDRMIKIGRGTDQAGRQSSGRGS
jgi:hypothetical protein